MSDDATFQLYKLLIEEVREARRARRELSNVFLSLNLAGVGALGLLASDQVGGLSPALLLWCTFALTLTCVIWGTSNRYYSHMLQVKYDILYELEQSLPPHPIKSEWERMKQRKGYRVTKAFSLEKAMPTLFILGYVVFLLIENDWSATLAAGGSFWNWIQSLAGGA